VILAAVLVSGTPYLRANSAGRNRTAIPGGVWGNWRLVTTSTPVWCQFGIVGIGISDDWAKSNHSGVYDWATLDAKIREAKAAGFQYIL